jgi:hypothetical protein
MMVAPPRVQIIGVCTTTGLIFLRIAHHLTHIVAWEGRIVVEEDRSFVAGIASGRRSVSCSSAMRSGQSLT